jgi:tetratricopeptide (TPR) repeat protein
MGARAAAPTYLAEDLPALAMSRPKEALTRAREMVASTREPKALSFAHQAAGIVLRDAGETDEALVEFRAALAAAQQADEPERVADVRASLGTSLVLAGRTRSGLAQLDRAVQEARGAVLGRVLLRRGQIYSRLGRHDEGLLDLRRSLAGLRAAGDTLWQARVLNNRALIHVARGSLARAERDIVEAEGLFVSVGQDLEALYALHNRGIIAFCRGDLPATLRLLDSAAARYEALSVQEPELAFHRCQAFLAAGLTSEAVAVVEDALAQPAIQAVRRPELLFVAAVAALADGVPEASLARAREARGLFRRQGRTWWELHAELVVLRSRRALGQGGPALAARAAAVGEQLAVLRSDEAPVALLLAGRLAAERQLPEAHAHLTAVSRYRRHGSALARATGWLGLALDREVAGDGRGVLSACRRGLDALDEHRASLGSTELRALATGHGQELASLAVHQALRAGRARPLLVWSERWRAITLAEPPVRPPRDTGRAGQMGALRTQARRLDEALHDDDGISAERERLAWERAVRHERHLLAGTGTRTSTQLDVAGLVDEVGEATLVELVEVDGVLHALTVHAGRVRHEVVGPAEEAVAAVGRSLFVLRQTARGRPTSTTGLAARLQAALLGATPPGDGPVIVAPSSRLHGAPWGLMPALAGRSVSVVPSASMWQRARARTQPANGGTVLVAGPGLGTGGAEVDVLARTVPGATLLRDGAATVEASLAALDGAALAHVAAHGHFRPDSPMFSSLVLDDGPLTVHDLELLDHAPHRFVLSACDSGASVPVGSDELLGLTSALLSLGTAGVLASVAEVNDEATVPFMLDVHRALASGAGLPGALLEARRQAAGDDLAEATAASFVALGV